MAQKATRDDAFLSAATIGEIRKGLVMIPQGRRRTELETWFHTGLLIWFRDRILPITQFVGDRWGVLDGQCQLRETPLNTVYIRFHGTHFSRVNCQPSALQRKVATCQHTMPPSGITLPPHIQPGARGSDFSANKRTRRSYRRRAPFLAFSVASFPRETNLVYARKHCRLRLDRWSYTGLPVGRRQHIRLAARESIA
jgi:hypothetical protein